MISKQVIITQCYQCPHQERMYAINEDGYNETVSATCALTNSSLDYMYYISFDLKSEYAFPKDCPLKDVEVIPI